MKYHLKAWESDPMKNIDIMFEAVTLEEMLQEFQYFLLACGYQINELELVERDTSHRKGGEG